MKKSKIVSDKKVQLDLQLDLQLNLQLDHQPNLCNLKMSRGRPWKLFEGLHMSAGAAESDLDPDAPFAGKPMMVSRRYAEVTTETSTSLSHRTKVPPPPTTVANRLNSLWFLNTSPCPPVSLQSSRYLPISLELSIHALVSMFTTSSGPVQYMSQQYEKDE
ncbi:hypothetical protein AYX14_06981 [Cryptococcus neoformans]|nr:hypothetical protein AYX14_06981 [Cryptococcus neoformans var. grubii]